MSKFKSRRPGEALRGRLWAIAAGLTAATLALVGCATSAFAVSAPRSAVPSVIRIADDQVVTTLNPVPDADYEFDQLTFLWGGFLTTYGPGKPELAKTVSSTDDFKLWTATLRPGVRFSNGTPIKPQDVVASFERVAKLKGIDADQFVGAFLSNLKSVTADGQSSVAFRFKTPNPDFAKQVSVPEMVIVPAVGLAEGDSFWNHPVSAGRYVVSSANLTDGDFTFTRNADYPGTMPEVKQVVVTAVPDAATRLAQLKSGQVDYAENLPGDLLPQITGNLRVDPAPWFGGSLFLQVNLAKGSIVSNLRVREAINLAVNRTQISQTALGGSVAGRPLYGIPWNQTNASPNVKAFSPNLTKAKQLLQGTPCAHGCTLPTVYYTDAVWQNPVTIQVVAQQLAKIGMKVQLQGIPFSSTDPYPKGWELWMGWTGDYDNSAITISNFYVINQWQASLGYSMPGLTSLGDDLAVAAPSREPALIRKANTMFAQDLPTIPLTTLTYLAGSSLPKSVLTNTGAAYFDIA
jgi:ABC-type transport system substrate-binding protein